jgi:hypothetical protein
MPANAASSRGGACANSVDCVSAASSASVALASSPRPRKHASSSRTRRSRLHGRTRTSCANARRMDGGRASGDDTLTMMANASGPMTGTPGSPCSHVVAASRPAAHAALALGPRLCTSAAAGAGTAVHSVSRSSECDVEGCTVPPPTAALASALAGAPPLFTPMRELRSSPAPARAPVALAALPFPLGTSILPKPSIARASCHACGDSCPPAPPLPPSLTPAAASTDSSRRTCTRHGWYRATASATAATRAASGAG